ncbi:hypothetical protein PMES_02887 [Profundibacterium mesophilum KAUST100406-0324]|uniref:Uncharacterized protein n=2 Tax=Profundibacterium TaxID=1258570 RepID=A0A921NNC6_9RHOB|nr:hypothetical protein PMES_02887 [Profundibacterium mesophilum KAUST100406-0324]
MKLNEFRAVLRRSKLPVPMLESLLICAGVVALLIWG